MPLIKTKPVDIIDVGTGNIANLCSAFKKINISYNLCSQVSDFKGGKIILPGVGAFADFMDKLKKKGIDNYIVDKSKEEISVLGICLGFQVLFSSSNEHRFTKGLNLLKGDFDIIKSNLLIPHVGWNDCEIIIKNTELFYGISNSSDFYFTHSYILKNYEKKDVVAFTKYGSKFPSVVKKNNIYGVQFHPEKSQNKGLMILKNFYERC
jgi:glutamine amidotransferase